MIHRNFKREIEVISLEKVLLKPEVKKCFFKLMCATSLGKLCASDHAMNAIDEMSALNRDLKKFFDEHGAAYPVWQALETEAGRYLQ